MKIRTKNTLLFLGLSLIPLMGMGRFAYENGRQAIKENLGSTFRQLAHAQIENVVDRLEDVYKNIEQWSKMSIMQEVVIDDMNATIQSFLMDIKKENKEFTYLNVITPEGRVVASTLPEMLETDSRGALSESFNRYIKTGKPHVSDVHYSDISKAWEITFSFPIKAEFEKDKIVGVLLAGWNAATLSRMARLSAGGEIEGDDKSNHFMLMRNDGLIIAAPEFEQHDVFKVNLIQHGLRSALLASRRHEGYLVEKDEHGAESLIGYDYARGQNDFPDLGWSGFVLSNTDTAFAAIERLKAVTFFGGLIVVVVVIILSIIASRKMTTPLLNIAGAADKVARGDFQTRIALDSKDEFGQVAKAFNAMAEDLQKTTVSKEYVDSIIANMNNSLIVLTPRMEIQMVNEAARALLGYTDEELLGQPFDMLLTGDGTSIRSWLDAVEDNEVVRNEEIQYRTKDGREIFVLFSAAGLKDRNNRFNGLVCVAQDITERKSFQKKLEAILEGTPDAMIIVNDKGEIILVNTQTEKIFGYPRAELLGKTAEIFLPEHLKSRHARHCENFTKDATIRPMGEGLDLFGITKDGRKIPLEISLGPIKTAQENLIIATMRNITERKAREDELREAHRELAEREKALRQTFNRLNSAHDELKHTQNQLVQSEKLASIGQLAAGVAHEINNPVGFINSNMEVLEQYMADYTKVLKMADQLRESVAQENPAKAKSITGEMTRLREEINLDYIISDTAKLLQHNRKGIERIQKIVMDLRTFAREGKDVLERVKIEDVIEGILTIVHSEIKYKAKLEKNYGGTPPIECNPQRLGQVFLNLIVNALQAIEGSGTIEIKTYTQDEFVCVDVRDTGKGIEEQNLGKVFDPFFTTKPVGLGTGLGLSVSHEIVKKHGGGITVRSKAGEGTTFTVSLPINQERKETS